MLDRVNIKNAVNPSKKLLTKMGLTPVLPNPFHHLIIDDDNDDILVFTFKMENETGSPAPPPPPCLCPGCGP